MLPPRYIVALMHFTLVAIGLKTLCILFPSSFALCFSQISYTLTFLVISNFTYEILKNLYHKAKVDPRNKAILITGCDSGFGNIFAKRLDLLGYTVFAGCLHPDGKGALELRNTCSENLKVFSIDVRNEDSILKARRFVEENVRSTGKNLWAVVNNAGILAGLTSELSSIEDFNICYEVNAVGPIRVSKAFLPLLRKTRGRVINLNSMSGRLPLFLMTPYSMSKHASVALTECLQQEMAIWGIQVISIEPEFFRTPMTNSKTVCNQIDALYATLSEDIKAAYGDKYLNYVKLFTNFIFGSSSENVHHVIHDLESAVCLKYPSSVYKPCRNILFKVIFYVAERLPHSVRNIMVMSALEVYTVYNQIFQKIAFFD